MVSLPRVRHHGPGTWDWAVGIASRRDTHGPFFLSGDGAHAAARPDGTVHIAAFEPAQ